MQDHVLGRPTIRISELDEESSRYDRMVAAPSDDELRKMWFGWSVTFFVSSAFNVTVFLSLVLSRKLRKSSFNKYLIGVSAGCMLPEHIMVRLKAIIQYTLITTIILSL